jgi:hypothetical protein
MSAFDDPAIAAASAAKRAKQEEKEAAEAEEDKRVAEAERDDGHDDEAVPDDEAPAPLPEARRDVGRTAERRVSRDEPEEEDELDYDEDDDDGDDDDSGGYDAHMRAKVMAKLGKVTSSLR